MATPTESGVFAPAFGLGNPHLQTMWGPIWRKMPALERRRERIWLDDGDFLDLDWHGPHDAKVPVVLVLHGLTGSSNSHYVVGLQHAMEKHGWTSVALNWRGCSGEPNLLPRSYHSGVSDDLAAVIAHLRRARPLAPLYAVGYSMGGNILLKHLGESGFESQLQGAAAVSVPFRLDECADRIGLGFSKVYQRHFMREMVGYIKDKQRRFQHEGMNDGLSALAALGSLDNLRTFWEFDGRVTAPLNGFDDAQDYYRKASSRYYLGAIRTPTLLVQSADDPFVFQHSLPALDELSPSTRFDLQHRGGHVGFVGGTLRKPVYYLEQCIPQWLVDVHGSAGAA
ncbi:hydrolase [Pseudomonas sp. GD03842]|uniref:hydrolase n=1 Tax=Pseudomonas sp. GD03842 TaxID=2975385 RepID=UPI0024498329|nr:hydrolase [Pseudomonas sp. GD03842]MDH0747260.1 hydrolase [Pseudomonas sp. GD03842]